MLLTKAQLNKASVKELQQAAASIKSEIAKRENSSKSELLKKVKKMAAEAGVSISDLLGKSGNVAAKPARPQKVSKPRGKVAPKYRNPADAAQTWTGRGRQPVWVAQALAAGSTLDALLIK